MQFVSRMRPHSAAIHLELAPPAPPVSMHMGGAGSHPAASAVRLVARERLAAAARGYEQVLAGGADGLHDLRVALRRLRTLLREFGPLIEDTVTRKTMRALRSLARATSDARDAEVAADWVLAQKDVPARARAGVRDAAARMVAERDAALKSMCAQLEREFPGLLARLEKQLADPRVTALRASAVASETFAEATAAVVERRKARLGRALERAKTMRDAEDVHRARIAAKRLRYVLEPLHADDAAYEPLQRLVHLQDALGAARDAHQMTKRFVREVGELAARDARLRALVAAGVKRKLGVRPSFARVKPGLVELARRAHADERRAFAEFRRTWGGGRAAVILDSIH